MHISFSSILAGLSKYCDDARVILNPAESIPTKICLLVTESTTNEEIILEHHIVDPICKLS
jgi:hypothetical protein